MKVAECEFVVKDGGRGFMLTKGMHRYIAVKVVVF